ncbi:MULTISPECIES: dicarboxylate/amino acid:cation symporter [Nocardiopsis]|uniref:Cation:dicarboxylase symporter family transporter n=2 Tax=Nocardiopsis alba TaxID=53437 RepID=A0A7K2IQ99_9ACTN|nr:MULTISPECIES: dicarboxylate/amino acid:cation symporter [Nocardiopsis]AFR06664.1 dicarboxylate symporter family protein [Nocardiopsis alba ATCC BAA-2165]MEC3892936.1 dicarboxylate/amino acid:cation symporter [Nocardiopsis sp. LDBS1602]MYR32152.1 cation:dicarboxylase symporter family transporter [Nocardiopsis alba]
MSAQTAEVKPKRRIPLPSFGVQVVLGLFLGLLLGFVALQIGPVGDGEPNWLAVTLQTIGSTFVTLLRAIVPPLIVLAVISSIANLRNVTNAARLAWKTLLWFAITALIAVGIGVALGLGVRPGVNSAVDAATVAEPSSHGSWLAFIESIVPANFLGLAADTYAGDDGSLTTSLSFNALQLIVIAIVLGIAAVKVGKPAEPFIKFTESTLQVVLKALWWVIRLAPIGTVGLLGNAVYSYGWDTIGSLGKFTLTIYIGLALVLFVVYPILSFANGLSPAKYFSGVWPALQLGFVSRSSMGTMPVTQRVTEQNLGVPRYYSAFAVPFGATTKMDGCAAIYPAISAIFVAQFFNIDLSITDYLLIVFVSVIGSAATAGTTGAIVMLTLTLSTVGLPLEGVGLLLAVDPILDMGRTAVNVAGQALVPAIVAKREGILDLVRFNARRGPSGFVPVDEPGTLSAEEAAAEAATEDAEENAPEGERVTVGTASKS